MTGRRRQRTLALCVALVCCFYLRCAWSYGKRVDPVPGLADFQNLQADAFLSGQFNLKLAVPDGLVRLPDPYDPVANREYREHGLHDLTFYHGRLYTYFGPAPVLLLTIPFRLLRVGDLPPTLACLILCLLGFFASVGVLGVLSRRFLITLPLMVESLAVLALGFAAPAGWLISIGRGYEVSIACGYTLAFAGLYFLARGLFESLRHPEVSLALGSFGLAGAVAARPNLFWFVTFIGFGLLFVRRSDSYEGDRRLATVALVIPYLTVAAALAWFNLARFGSVTEFGTSYMLLGENVRLARANELDFLRRGLFEFLLSPARLVHRFPWFRLRPLVYPVPTERSYLEEPVAGLLPNMPACLLGVVAFAAQPWRRLRERPWLNAFIALVAMTGFIIVAVNSYHFHGATMRYQMDYAPLLLLASILGGLIVLERLKDSSFHWYRVGIGIAAVVVLWSAFFSVAITTYPCVGTGSC